MPPTNQGTHRERYVSEDGQSVPVKFAFGQEVVGAPGGFDAVALVAGKKIRFVRYRVLATAAATVTPQSDPTTGGATGIGAASPIPTADGVDTGPVYHNEGTGVAGEPIGFNVSAAATIDWSVWYVELA